MLSHHDECGESFRRYYEQGERGHPNEYLIVGSALDAAVMADLKRKLNYGVLLDEDAVIEIATEHAYGAFTRPTSIARKDFTRIRDESIQRVIAFTRYAHRKLCPTINVKSVQRKWSVRLDPILLRRSGLEERYCKIDLVGTLDIEEWMYDFSSPTEPIGVCVRDLKSAKASPPKGAANGKHWLQLTCYAFGLFVADGTIPLRTQIDTLISGPRGVIHKPSYGERNKYDFAALFNRIVRFAQARAFGLYMPAPRGSWKCSDDYCDFYGDCPFVKNKKTIDVALSSIRGYTPENTCNDATPALNLLEWLRKEEQCQESARSQSPSRLKGKS